MLAAYQDRPTVSHVMKVTGVGYKLATKAVKGPGWPELDLPPFVQLSSPAPDVDLDARTPTDSAALPSEGDAIDIAMSSAISLTKALQKYTSQMLERLENVPADGEISPKTVGVLVRALSGCSTILKQAVSLQRARQEAPRSAFWAELGALLDRATDAELVVIADTGELPLRLISARPASTAQLLRAVSADGPAFDGQTDVVEAPSP